MYVSIMAMRSLPRWCIFCWFRHEGKSPTGGRQENVPGISGNILRQPHAYQDYRWMTSPQKMGPGIKKKALGDCYCVLVNIVSKASEP